MILYEKIKERYSRKELEELLGRNTAGRIYREEIEVLPVKISSRIDVSKLEYSLDDFKVDYEHMYKEHKEVEMIFALFIKGLAPNTLKKKYNLETMIYSHLKYGFDYNSTSRNLHLVLKQLGVEVNISRFTIDFYKTHIELFGLKEDLESFKKKYNIKYDIYWEPYRESWHLAFNGCLAEYIREEQRK